MTEAFRVPADLATLDLKLSDVQKIIEIRRRKNLLQGRLERLPVKRIQLENQIEEISKEEAAMIETAKAGV